MDFRKALSADAIADHQQQTKNPYPSMEKNRE
jgi:hypothetical protein